MKLNEMFGNSRSSRDPVQMAIADEDYADMAEQYGIEFVVDDAQQRYPRIWKQIVRRLEDNIGVRESYYDREEQERRTEDSYNRGQERFKRREQSAGLEHEDEYERRRPSQRSRRPSMGTRRQYLNVPYSEREAAKAEGARWDPEKKKWYKEVPFGTQYDPFKYRHWVK